MLLNGSREKISMLMRNNKVKRSLSQFLQSPPNLVLAQTLPVALLRPYIHALGFAYYLVRRKERKETSSTIISRIANGSNRVQRYSLLYNTYRGIFDHYLEKLMIATRSSTEMAEYLLRHCHIDSKKWLDIVEVAGRGGILATGHIGAGEFLPVLLALHGYSIAVLVRYKTERLRKFAKQRANAYGIVMIDVSETSFSFVRAIKAIKEGRILVIFCDEFDEWSPIRKYNINVFGEIYPADKGLGLLQRRTGAPAAVGVLCRTNEKNGIKYRLSINPISGEDPEVPVSARAWEIVQEYINKYPEQWYKWHVVGRELARYKLKK